MKLNKAAALATAIARLCLAQDKPSTETAKPKPPEETFYSQAQHAILRLEYSETNAQTKVTSYHFATGFLVHTANNWYVITAAHVASEPISYTAKAPLLLDDGETVPREWYFRTTSGNFILISVTRSILGRMSPP